MLNQPGLFDRLPSFLDRDLILLDLETTGTNPAAERVIEVGLLHLRDLQVVNRWSQLVNPERQLSAFIESHTGIHQGMLTTAPTFAEIADELWGYLQQGLLVAHNSRFDYGFLQAEYARLGRKYQAPSLCTVKLSRRLFPQHRRHSLDALIDRHGLHCDSRHRALDDVLVLADFLKLLPDHCPRETIEAACKAQL